MELTNTINVKFMALVEDGEGTAQVAAGIITNAPSIEAVKEKLEYMGAAVINIEEATDEEVANADEV